MSNFPIPASASAAPAPVIQASSVSVRQKGSPATTAAPKPGLAPDLLGLRAGLILGLDGRDLSNPRNQEKVTAILEVAAAETTSKDPAAWLSKVREMIGQIGNHSTPSETLLDRLYKYGMLLGESKAIQSQLGSMEAASASRFSTTPKASTSNSAQPTFTKPSVTLKVELPR